MVALVFILESLGVKATGLVALIGAAGLAIGLALKDTIGHIAAGIMILLLRPFKSGHYIECSSISGTVKEIGLFSTTLETSDGLYVMAPNSSLWGSPIKNITRNGKRRMDLIIGISYQDSIDTGFEVLRDLISKEKRFLSDPAPQVMVLSMGDSSVNLQLRAWTSIDNYWKTYWENNKMLKEAIEAAGLTIPFPQVDVHQLK
jgi:small conductance mechanosensitive channel